MNLNPTWQELALRLLCTLLGGALIGINRGERGRTAGLRTTMLVCLAASVSMVLANLLFSEVAKTPELASRLDFMRLPLGILTGVGFIGAGAIFRKENLVIGVTTAATLWFVTVMGLCFGGGEIGLGFATLGLGLFVLWFLKWVETYWKQEKHATLIITTEQTEPIEDEIVKLFSVAGYRLRISAITFRQDTPYRKLTAHVSWRGKVDEPQPPKCVKEIAARLSVVELNWILEQA